MCVRRKFYFKINIFLKSNICSMKYAFSQKQKFLFNFLRILVSMFCSNPHPCVCKSNVEILKKDIVGKYDKNLKL